MRNSQRAIVAVLGVIVGSMIALAIWVRVAAPEPPRLSGERATRAYDYADFDGVEISGQWRTTIERGDAWRVSIDVPEELISEVSVQRDGDVLDVAYEGAWPFGDFDREDDALQAVITMPALETIHLAGTTQLSFSGFEGSSLSLDVTGAAAVRGAASRFDALRINMAGFGNIDLRDVTVTNADVEMSGTGNVTLRMAGGRLTGEMSGFGNLEYSGTVSEESVEKSGFGSIRRRN